MAAGRESEMMTIIVPVWVFWLVMGLWVVNIVLGFWASILRGRLLKQSEGKRSVALDKLRDQFYSKHTMGESS